MLKNNLILVFLLVVSFGFGQNNRFVYEYQFKIDSLNRDSIIKENMVLDVTPQGSKFYSAAKFIADSTINASISKAKQVGNMSFDFRGLPQTKVPFGTVLKHYPDFKSIFLNNISATPVAMEDTPKFDWKLDDEKSEVLGYPVQKATTNFGGRKWIAWFASDIPIQDGPYRFYGLPGLILKIQDTKGDHIFTAISSKKLKNPVDFKFEKNPNVLVVNEKQFNKLWNDYKKDPSANLRNNGAFTAGNRRVVVTTSFNGKPINTGSVAKEIEKEMKSKLAKRNNFIELNLYR